MLGGTAAGLKAAFCWASTDPRRSPSSNLRDSSSYWMCWTDGPYGARAGQVLQGQRHGNALRF